MIRAFLCALAALLLMAGSAQAHTRSQSRSNWVVSGDVIEASIEADALDVTRLYALGGEAPLDAVFAREVGGAFSVSAAGGACAAQGAPVAAIEPGGRIVARLRFTCPAGALARGPIEIESQLFLAVAPSHLHFLALNAGEAAAEAVLTESHTSARLVARASGGAESFTQAFARFVPIGATHVWTGLDHMAFMLALVLLAGGGLWRVLAAATGFTLGHTATLGFAALGVLQPDQPAIEALIGFTIAFVALGAGATGEARLRDWSTPAAIVLALGGAASLFGLVSMSPLVWFGLAAFVYAYPRGMPRDAIWLAAIFGLIHGCGFAGALAELDLPQPRLLASLLGFNVGVELGQVAVIGAALGAAALARQWRIDTRSTAQWAGALLFALGIFWFAGRLTFPWRP